MLGKYVGDDEEADGEEQVTADGGEDLEVALVMKLWPKAFRKSHKVA